MKKFAYFVALILFVSACSPANTAVSPTETPTATIVPTATNTSTPQPTSTLTPTITPSPTLSLPVSYQTPIPASNSKINPENVKNLQEIARYYGQMYFTAALSGDHKLLFVRDPVGVDIYDYQTNKHLNHVDLLGSTRGGSLQVDANGEWALVDDYLLIHFTPEKEPEIQNLYSMLPLKEGNRFRESSISLDSHKFVNVEIRCDYNGCNIEDRFQIISLPDLQVIYSWGGGYSDMHGQNPVFSPDGSLILTRVENQIIIWRTSDQTQVAAVKNIQGNFQAVFSKDSSLIAIGQLDTVQIWDVSSGKEIQAIKSLCGDLNDPPQPILLDSNRVVVWECPRNGKGNVSGWSIADGTSILKRNFGDISASQIVAEDDSNQVTLLENPRKIVGPWIPPNTLYTFQFLDNGDLTFVQLDEQFQEMACIIMPDGKVNCPSNVILGTDEQFYDYWMHDNLIEFFRGFTNTGRAIYSLSWKNSSLEALDPINNLLFYTKYTGLNTGNSNVLNLENNTSRGEWKNSYIERIVFSGNKSYAAFCNKDHVFGIVYKPNIDRLIIFDLAKKEVVYQQSFTCFAPLVLSNDGKKLFATQTLPTYSHRLLIMNTVPPIERKEFDIGCDKMNALALTPEETMLAVACNDGTLRFLNPDTASEIYRLTNIDPDMWGLAFSKDGTKLAMASKRGYISIWAIPPFSYNPSYQANSIPSPTLIPTKTPSCMPVATTSRIPSNFRIIKTDSFDNPQSKDWGTDSSLTQIKDGCLTILGKNWNGTTYNIGFSENHGVVINFKYTYNSFFEMILDNGNWNTNSYKRFGVYVHNDNIETNIWQGKTRIFKQTLTGNLNLNPDSWYSLLLTMGKNSEFSASIWDPSNPAQVVNFQKRLGADWSGLDWMFKINVSTGTILFDDFKEVETK